MNMDGESRKKSLSARSGRPVGVHALSESRIKTLLQKHGHSENRFFRTFARCASMEFSSATRKAVRERVYCLGRNGKTKFATDETLRYTLESLGQLLGRIIESSEVLAGPPSDPLDSVRGWISRSDPVEAGAFSESVLNQAVLYRAYCAARSGSEAVRSFNGGTEGKLLSAVAMSASPWAAAACFVRAKLLSVDLMGKSTSQRRTTLNAALSAWRKINVPAELPAPMLLPGVGTEAPLESLLAIAGGQDPETASVPVPYRYRATLGLALAYDALLNRRATKFEQMIAQVESDIQAGAGIEKENPILELNLRLCQTILLSLKRFKGGSDHYAQEAASDSALSLLDEFASRAGFNAKYWEWKAVAEIGRLLSTPRGPDKNRLFDNVCDSIRRLLEFRQGNAPFLALDPAYSLAFCDMNAGPLLDEFVQQAGFLKSE